MAQSAIPEERVRDQLKKIIASRFFQPSELQSKFLRFTVEKTLSGAADEIKEYVVGAEAFGRGPGFDPRIDSVVRVVARHVRDKLAEYYATEGRQDLILIHLTKGSYVPSFSFRDQPRASSPSPAEPSLEIPDRAELTGRIISHYEVLGLLGQGSKASVYRAEDLRLKRGVALKFLSETFAADPAWIERFRREAQSTSAASHPGICGVYDVGDYQGRPYIVLELIEGETLGQFIQNQPLPVDTLVDLGLQISDALAMANAQGIIHHDVRPGNIIVNRRGKAKLLDFGMAEALPLRAQAAAVADVTLAVSGREAGTRGDIAGIGAILYEMATGQSPPAGGNTSPGLLTPAFPPKLNRLINDAITANPRLRTVSDIVDELNNFKHARDLEESGADAVTLANLGKLIRLKWVWMTAIAAALLCVAGYSFLRPISPPRILKYTQLTHDAQGKLESFSAGTPPPLMTDGSRLYFTEVSGSQIVVSEVSASGGETVPLRPDLKQPLVLVGISPNESELLAADFLRASPDEPLRILPLPGGIPRPIGNLVGHDGAWSEDGSRICYAKGNHLYVAGADGSGSTMLASLPGLPSWPRWSPDGSKLRFTLQDVDGGTSLWEVSEDGNNPHPLLPNWNGHPAECCGSWSPDGKYFVFQSTRQSNTGLWALREDRWPLVRPRAAPVRLTGGPLNVWAPVFNRDGRKIFAVVQQRRGELVRYDSKSSTFSPYLSGISADHVDFARDSQWIAYSAYPEQTIWRSRLDGTERLQLSHAPMAAIFPRWSPDGRRIAFLGSLPGKAVRIYVVNSSGGNVEPLLPGESPQIDPNWSPDGKSIMFAALSSVTDMSSGQPKIEVLGLETKRLSTLPGSAGLTAPRWSPGGRFVVATSLSQGKWGNPAVLIFDFNTGVWAPLENDPIDNKWWSADGKYFYFDKYTNDDPAIFRIRLSDRKIERVASLKNMRRAFNEMGWWMGITPDGSPMVLRDTSIEEIYALDWDAP